MLDIIIHQGNTNQNHHEVSLYTHNNYNQKSDSNKYWQRCKEDKTLIHPWSEYKCGVATLKDNVAVPQFDSAILLPGIYPKGLKTLLPNYLHMNVH